MTATTEKKARPSRAKAPASDSTATQQQGPKNPRNAAYSSAERRLRDAHPEEFQALLQEETEKLGLEYKPRMSAQERAALILQEKKAKAAAKIAALVAEFGEDVLAAETVDLSVEETAVEAWG
jgi:hypothetical protein